MHMIFSGVGSMYPECDCEFSALDYWNVSQLESFHGLDPDVLER
jgi:hypothetical protein